jgi:hypothetical protein
MHRQAIRFVFDPYARKNGKIFAQDGAHTAKRDSRRAGNRRPAAALPSIEAHTADFVDGDVTEKFVAPAAADHRDADAGEVCEATEQAPCGRRESYLVGTWRDGCEGTVKIEEQGHPRAFANAVSHLFPMRQKMGRSAR